MNTARTSRIMSNEKQAMRVIIQIKSRYLTNSALFVLKPLLNGKPELGYTAIIGLFLNR